MIAKKKVSEVIDFAKTIEQKNIPYIWAGNCPYCDKGVDCSGFVQFVLWYAGIDPIGDQSAQMLYDYYARQGWRSMRGPGAIIFYGKSRYEITHIAIEIEGDKVIEAGGGTSRTLRPTDGASVRVRPFDHRSDIVAVIMPNYLEE